MTYVIFAALAALLYFGSAFPAQVMRCYRLGVGGGRRTAGWWARALLVVWPLQALWLCVPAALIYAIGLIIVAA